MFSEPLKCEHNCCTHLPPLCHLPPRFLCHSSMELLLAGYLVRKVLFWFVFVSSCFCCCCHLFICLFVWIQNIGREKWGCYDDTLTTIPRPLEPACGRNVEELELLPREVLACCKQSSMGRADPSLEGKEANRDIEWRLSSLGLWGEQGFSWEWGRRPFMLYSGKESRSVSWKPEWGWIQKQWTSLSDRGNFKTA